jgi:hypothetical protein
LAVSAYVRLKEALLHHDDIDGDDLIEGVFVEHTARQTAEPTVLFILDLEWIGKGSKKQGELYLTVDLIETIRQASLRVPVVAVAALGATESGTKWIERLGFQGAGTTRHEYFGLKHDWTLYEMTEARIRKIAAELTKLGWPDMSQRAYPFVVGKGLEVGACEAIQCCLYRACEATGNSTRALQLVQSICPLLHKQYPL